MPKLVIYILNLIFYKKLIDLQKVLVQKAAADKDRETKNVINIMENIIYINYIIEIWEYYYNVRKTNRSARE